MNEQRNEYFTAFYPLVIFASESERTHL